MQFTMHIKRKYHPILTLYLMALIVLFNNFLLPHIAHFDNIVFLPLLVFETFGSMFSVSFLHFKQYDFIFIGYLQLVFLDT